MQRLSLQPTEENKRCATEQTNTVEKGKRKNCKKKVCKFISGPTLCLVFSCLFLIDRWVNLIDWQGMYNYHFFGLNLLQHVFMAGAVPAHTSLQRLLVMSGIAISFSAKAERSVAIAQPSHEVQLESHKTEPPSKVSPAYLARQETKTISKCYVQVTGMTCASCVANIERNLRREDGKIHVGVICWISKLVFQRTHLVFTQRS